MTSSPLCSIMSKMSKTSSSLKNVLTSKTLIHVSSKTVIAVISKPLSTVNAIDVMADIGSCNPEFNEESCESNCECYGNEEQEETGVPTLCAKFKQDLENEVKCLTERFNLLLHNEQVRASYMLREAHRERQEKIQALQTQLECKNLSSLMYVVCMERRKSKLEKLRLIEEYTSYIRALQEILTEGQGLILHLSRGYKTAARVDDEWRDKMTSIIQQFQAFIYHFSGGSPETNQYFFDLPKLLQTQAPTQIDPEEDPCTCEEEEQPEPEPDASASPEEDNATKDLWFNHLTGDDRPFVVFGDMSDFMPDERREACRIIKSQKTAPKRWKSYAFNEMFLKPSDCPNLDYIKDEYPEHMTANATWNTCDHPPASVTSESPVGNNSRRATSLSVDAKNMGSILKIITTTQPSIPPNRTIILAARDSMELQSTTRLLERHRQQKHQNVKSSGINIENLDIKKRRQSYFDDLETTGMKYSDEDEEEIAIDNKSLANDSMACLKPHEPDPDKINFEKICPAEKCRRMSLDDFMQSLPPYMRANPFMHFEQTFEQYQPCSPEQLAILKKRIDDKNDRDSKSEETRHSTDPLAEWESKDTGIATQTSFVTSLDLPPCTCADSEPSENSENTKMYNVKDLIPIKQALDRIKAEYMFNEDIDFNRFKVIGQGSKDTINKEVASSSDHKDFTTTRLEAIKKTLKQHPSLLDIFQANTRC